MDKPKVAKGQVYIDTDSRMNSRQLTVEKLVKYKKDEGRFKKGHTYAVCETMVGRRVVAHAVKVDIVRLHSSAYRLISERFDPILHKNVGPWKEAIITMLVKPTVPVMPDACESVENCGCPPAKISADEPVSPA